MFKTHTVVTLHKKQHNIGYPNVGQRLEIESMKQVLSNGTYGQLARSDHKAANQLLDLVDAISYFTVMLGLEITLEQFKALDPVASAEYIGAFRTYYKFLLEVEAEIAKPVKTGDDDA